MIRGRFTPRIGAFILSVTLCVSLAGCTREKPTPGKIPFSFDVAPVTSLLLSKNHPETGDRWDARFERKNQLWEVVTGPDGVTLTDHMADSGFLDHLLDTFRTLRTAAPAPNGPLASFGLQPPHFAVKWSQPETRTTSAKEWKLLVGNFAAVPVEGDRQDRGAYTLVNDESPSIVIGAALRMLEMIESFDVVRQRRFHPFNPDDIQQVSLTLGKRPSLVALRQGDAWGNAKGRPIRQPVTEFLTQLSHTRVQAFINDAEKTAELRSRVEKHPEAIHAIFTDIHDEKSDIWIRKVDQKWLGITTQRPLAVFVLHDKTAALFEGLLKGKLP